MSFNGLWYYTIITRQSDSDTSRSVYQCRTLSQTRDRLEKRETAINTNWRFSAIVKAVLLSQRSASRQ